MARLGAIAFLLACGVAASVTLQTGPDEKAAAPQAAQEDAGLTLGTAEMYMEKGARAKSWLPCTITSKKRGNLYDVHLVAGGEGNYFTDLFNVNHKLLRKADKKTWNEGMDALRSNPSLARTLVGEVEREHMARKAQSIRATGMNETAVKKLMAAKFRSEKFRSQRVMRERGCPTGYETLVGDVKGPDQFGRGGKKDTVDLCAADCNVREDCLSFEFSPTNHKCNMNKVPDPNGKISGDFVFCKRIPKTQLRREKHLAKLAAKEAAANAAEDPAAAEAAQAGAEADPAAAEAEPAAAEAEQAAAEPEA